MYTVSYVRTCSTVPTVCCVCKFRAFKLQIIERSERCRPDLLSHSLPKVKDGRQRWRMLTFSTPEPFRDYGKTNVTTSNCVCLRLPPYLRMSVPRPLLQNTSAKTLHALSYSHDDEPHMEATDWMPFWNAIACSTTLTKIDLNCSPLFSLSRFLDTFTRSSSIKVLRLRGGIVSVESFSTFLRTTKSVTRLELSCLNFEDALNPTDAAVHLSSAIAENTSIKYFQLVHIRALYQSALFRGLTGHTQIRTLVLDRDIRES